MDELPGHEPRPAGILHTEPPGLDASAIAAGGRCDRLLPHHGPERHAGVAGRDRTTQRRGAAHDPGRGQRAHRRNALLRQPRGTARTGACAGVRRPATGISAGACGRRPLLGWRHLLQHPGRSGVRRQSAPQLARLRGAVMAPGRRRSAHDVASLEQAEGYPVREPGRQPCAATGTDPSAAAHRA